ncbi:neutral zinc metallopeptidase [Actinoplanes flavus]|uniref:Neutral zinc metallopeptidase n=1 Tax=Actinoplanes flavus TaxID=2820290 RepID=A0ABS3UN01_9ACTN|nr:neutral zinc metallopeptidase [Actinoplanes flavus]MBO3740150.1 neutral zinc metallopeptidase [Actinoplanes flavus]
MRTERRGLPALLSGLLFLIALPAGCAVGPPTPPTAGGGGGGGWDLPEPAPESAPEPAATGDDATQAVQVANAFWAAAWSNHFTGAYQPPEIYGPFDEGNAPLCAGRPLETGNAYYCLDGYIAWDAGFLDSGGEFGDGLTWLVLNHEVGHAVQDQLDESLVIEAAELQADCLAGAALAGAARDGLLVYEPGDDEELAAVFAVAGDDTPWNGDSGAHGTTEQRVEFFTIGADGGVGACLPASA